jgi:hypothetical protein
MQEEGVDGGTAASGKQSGTLVQNVAHGVTSGRKSMGAAWIMSNSMSLTPAPSPPIKDLGNTAAHSRPMEGGNQRVRQRPHVALLGGGE